MLLNPCIVLAIYGYLLTIVKNIKTTGQWDMFLKFMVICLEIVESIGTKIKRKQV